MCGGAQSRLISLQLTSIIFADKYVTVSRLVNIEQYSTSTGKLVNTETFSEKNVQEQLQ
jgi:hypothetical protein